MSGTDVNYASLKADLRADRAATLVRDVSEASIRSLHIIPTAERRENLLALATAIVAADGAPYLTEHIDAVVRYYATAADPLPPFGRLLRAAWDCNADEVDAALERLVAA